MNFYLIYLQIIKENLEFEISLRLFLRASELTRHFSAHFYNESSYFIKKAVIVCVDPKPDQEGKKLENILGSVCFIVLDLSYLTNSLSPDCLVVDS
jgi:hypothetical protein